jgi:hypothetical protein
MKETKVIIDEVEYVIDLEEAKKLNLNFFISEMMPIV